MSFLLVANFKSHKTRDEVKSWLEEVAPVAKNSPATIIVALSFVHLPLTMGYEPLAICAQDVSPFPPGSYTGAVNARQLQELGVKYCLIGHSERRHYFHETANEVAGKAKELLDAKITPIICLAKDDLSAQRAALDDNLSNQCIFCYEPPADIGGTETAAIADIQTTMNEIKKIFSVDQVMYGGSVNEGNIESLLVLNLSGVLVASASLSSAQFNQIIAKLGHGKI